MMSNRSLKLKLHALDPRCHWCGRETILTNDANLKKKTTSPLMATIDHVVSRYNPLRWVKRQPDEVRKVLACFECNNRRASEEMAQLSREELFKRGQGFALNKTADGKPIFVSSVKTVDEVLDKLKEHGIVVNTNNTCTTST
jgi:hypothetical protein